MAESSTRINSELDVSDPEPPSCSADPPSADRIQIACIDRQHSWPVAIEPLEEAARTVAAAYGFQQGDISIAVVDDSTIHQLNQEYLGHDYPTDCISFLFEAEGDRLEGEVVISADTAWRQAEKGGWPAEHELLLYLIHGMLHLCGLDDTTTELANQMRSAEQAMLRSLGIEPPGALEALDAPPAAADDPPQLTP
jgi:probable rRNA maturation factor